MRPNCPERLSCPPITPVFRELPTAGHIGRHTPDAFTLPSGALWSVEPHRDLQIQCVVGQLWITQSGDARDVVLLPGETYAPATKGRIVVQALSDSRVTLT